MVTKMKKTKGILLVVSGPAGTGKGSILKEIFDSCDDFVYSVSSTTRAPRPGEVNGVHYNFITKEEFEALIRENAVIEYTQYCGNYYGTSRKVVQEELKNGKNVVLEIEVDGAMQIKKQFPDTVLIGILPESFSVLEARLRGRGTNTEEDILNRLERSREELRFIENYDYIIVNRDGGIKEAAKQLVSIVECEKLRPSRNPDFYNEFYNN